MCCWKIKFSSRWGRCNRQKQVSEPINYFEQEAANSKGSGLSGPRDGEESSSVQCLAWKKKIDAEANVVSAPERSSFPPDEVDAIGKNKSKSRSSILSGRQPSQKALDWVDQETERSPQVSHTWCGNWRFMLRLMWCRLLKDEVLLQMRQMKQAETSLKAYWVFEQEAAKSKGSGLSRPGDG